MLSSLSHEIVDSTMSVHFMYQNEFLLHRLFSFLFTERTHGGFTHLLPKRTLLVDCAMSCT